MAKVKAVYEPGELDRVRGKLGSIDPTEAKRMAQILGGEVGFEKPASAAPARPISRRQTAAVTSAAPAAANRPGGILPRRRHGSSLWAGDDGKPKPPKKPQALALNPADDPKVPVRQSYWERVKMDRLCGSAEFDIKSAAQVLRSMLPFGNPPDRVSAVFVNRRMDEYYKHVEQLVATTRLLLPRSNLARNEQFRRLSPAAYAVADLFRQWDIEKIAGDLARLQASPRRARVVDFRGILKAIYRPLFLTERLDMENHVKESYRQLYKILFMENPAEAQNKQQGLIRSAMAAFDILRRDVRFLLYPLLLKLLSDKFLAYDAFFAERRHRLMAFLEATETDRLAPQDIIKKIEPGEADRAKAEQERRAALDAEKKALDRGLGTLETLFPKAGWDRLPEFPDLFPYFAEMLGLEKNAALIAPADPLQQVMVLTRILEEIFFGLRYVQFSAAAKIEGLAEDIGDAMAGIMDNWHFYSDVGFGKEYLPRLAEYCRLLDSPGESRTSPYAKRLANEIQWTKRLYFLPYYKFESSAPPPFQKKDLTALYPEIRRLRKRLTAVASGIERGIKAGGPEGKARCEGIENPWEAYNFQIPNPVSTRLDALLGKKNTNASLIFYALAVTVALDNLVNNENSWAYGDKRGGVLFRSEANGLTPAFGVDEKIDADALFKQSL